MEETTTKAQVTSLFDNRVLSRLERMRIVFARRPASRAHGEHLFGRGGSSTEFSDFRDYVPGDDVRFVDWNVFARLNRPYIKLFELEEEMHVALLVDASGSMLFEDKIERAKQLAAAFGVMGLLGVERVSVSAFNGNGMERLPPCTGRASMLKLFTFLERLEGGGEAPLERGIEEFLKRHVGKGVAIILSDFLTFGDIRRGCNLLFSAGLDVQGVQVLGPSELEPDLTADLRLVDSETLTTLDITAAADILAIYQEHREGFARELATLCRQRQGRFAAISAADPLDWVLFDLLRRGGWIE
ncbi:MAG: DUF58 domain-containing protein [Planctomycetes bacterium]|nr:DUF58 domain-containing protein [Planctomycetota bacterium]